MMLFFFFIGTKIVRFSGGLRFFPHTPNKRDEVFPYFDKVLTLLYPIEAITIRFGPRYVDQLSRFLFE